MLLSVFVFLTSHPAHTIHQCSRNRTLLHFKQLFRKEKSQTLKLLGTSDQHVEFYEILDFITTIISFYMYTGIEHIVNHVDVFIYYLEGVF